MTLGAGFRIGRFKGPTIDAKHHNQDANYYNDRMDKYSKGCNYHSQSRCQREVGQTGQVDAMTFIGMPSV